MRRRAPGLFQPRRDFGELPPALRRAHELMNLGDYAQAALAFEQLATGAEQRRGPRAPFLFIQAGRARVLQGQAKAGMQHIRRGLELLAQEGRYNQFYRVGQRIAQELRTHGMEKEAQDVSEYIRESVPATADMPTEHGPDLAKISLPTRCPSCGAPLRTTEVEWLDKSTAECPYCGSPVQAE